MASKVPAPSQDIRQQGWPCHGNHVPSSEQGNQWGRWVNCGRCGIRLQYTATAGKGKHRTAGPQPHILKKAIEELQLDYEAENMTEQIMKGKIIEIQGRKLQAGEHVKFKNTMEARDNGYVMEMLMAPTCDG